MKSTSRSSGAHILPVAPGAGIKNPSNVSPDGLEFFAVVARGLSRDAGLTGVIGSEDGAGAGHTVLQIRTPDRRAGTIRLRNDLVGPVFMAWQAAGRPALIRPSALTGLEAQVMLPPRPGGEGPGPMVTPEPMFGGGAAVTKPTGGNMMDVQDAVDGAFAGGTLSPEFLGLGKIGGFFGKIGRGIGDAIGAVEDAFAGGRGFPGPRIPLPPGTFPVAGGTFSQAGFAPSPDIGTFLGDIVRGGGAAGALGTGSVTSIFGDLNANQVTDRAGRIIVRNPEARTVEQCPSGYVLVTLPENGARVCMLRDVAIDLGLFTRRAKAPISATEWRMSKAAARVNRKLRRIADTAAPCPTPRRRRRKACVTK